MERKWWTLIVVCVGTFMLLLDITIVNVALPKIASELHASFSDIQWVIDAYALTLASFLLTAGSLADLFGRRLLYAIGLSLFSFTSLLCAVSPSALFLILARAGQGIGGAIMFATALALLAQEFQGRERGTAFGIWGATISVAAAIGPLLGGALTEGFGWASIFVINVPIGIVAAFLTITQVGESRDPEGKRVDWVGTVTWTRVVPARVRDHPRQLAEWGSTTIVALFALSGVLLAGFLISQFVQRNAMFDVSLFRKPDLLRRLDRRTDVSAAMFAMFLYLTLYLQTLLGFSPLQTGLRFLPFTVISFFTAILSGNLSERVPARVLLGVGVGMVGSRAISDAGPDSVLGMDRAAARLPGVWRRPRPRQPRARLDGDRRRTSAAQRNGGWHQQHFPAGRDRHRHRRAGRDLRERHQDRPGAQAGGVPGRWARHAGRPCRGGRRHPKSARPGSRRRPTPGPRPRSISPSRAR